MLNIEIFVKDNLIKKVPVYAAENVKKVNVFNQSVADNKVNEFVDPVKNETPNISSSKITKVSKNISTKEEINQKYLPYELRTNPKVCL